MPKSPAPAQSTQTTNNNKDLGISVPDSQTLSSDTKNSKKYTVSINKIIVHFILCMIACHSPFFVMEFGNGDNVVIMKIIIWYSIVWNFIHGLNLIWIYILEDNIY